MLYEFLHTDTESRGDTRAASVNAQFGRIARARDIYLVGTWRVSRDAGKKPVSCASALVASGDFEMVSAWARSGDLTGCPFLLMYSCDEGRTAG